MGLTINEVRRTQIILSIMFTAVSLVFVLSVHFGSGVSDVARNYFPYADQLINGTIPNIEYPPFALVFLTIPRIFATTPLGYEAVFVIEVFIFFVIGLIIISKLAKRYNQSQRLAMLVYAALMILIFEFVVDRYDIFPVILTLLAFYCFVTKRYTWAFVILSIATMTKLYPAVLFPIFLIPFIINRDWSNTVKGVAAYVLAALLIVLPLILLGSDMVTNFLEYHMDRPLQLESTTSSIIYLLSMFGLTTVWVEFGYGSDNLMGALPDAVVPYLTPLVVILLLVLYIVYAYLFQRLRKEGCDNENNRMVLLGSAALLSILIFIAAGKVFSSQFVIWIIPFVAFLFMTSIDHRIKKHIVLLSIIVILLTQAHYYFNIIVSGGGANITDLGMLGLLARNLIMIVLAIFVVKASKDYFYRRSWRHNGRDDRSDQKL